MKKPFKPQKQTKPAAPVNLPAKSITKSSEITASRPISSMVPAKLAASNGKSAAAATKQAPAKPSGSTGMKPVSPRRLVTTITAIIDVGFGNMLYLRGEGPGLSWEKGVPLECADANRWTLTVGESSRPVVCKFLINDSEWNKGEDYTVAPGTSITITPVF